MRNDLTAKVVTLWFCSVLQIKWANLTGYFLLFLEHKWFSLCAQTFCLPLLCRTWNPRPRRQPHVIGYKKPTLTGGAANNFCFCLVFWKFSEVAFHMIHHVALAAVSDVLYRQFLAVILFFGRALLQQVRGSQCAAPIRVLEAFWIFYFVRIWMFFSHFFFNRKILLHPY